jgi:hypothetical protein
MVDDSETKSIMSWYWKLWTREDLQPYSVYIREQGSAGSHFSRSREEKSTGTLGRLHKALARNQQCVSQAV